MTTGYIQLVKNLLSLEILSKRPSWSASCASTLIWYYLCRQVERAGNAGRVVDTAAIQSELLDSKDFLSLLESDLCFRIIPTYGTNTNTTKRGVTLWLYKTKEIS